MKTPASRPAYWSQIIFQQQRSNQSIAEFCRGRGLAQPSFFVWRRRLRAGISASTKTVCGFVELKTSTPDLPEPPGSPAVAPPGAAALELLLPCGARVLVGRGFDRDVLRELVSALGDPS